MYDLQKLRKEFPILAQCIYLDSASTSQTPRCSVDAMCEYFFEYAANHGRGAHHLARKTTEKYEETRSRLGNFLNVSPDHIIFTKNTTDAVNTVANGLTWKRGDEIITTWLEHHSNLLPWMNLKKKGFRIATREGIFSGMSSGAALAGVLKVAESLDSGTIVTIFPDRGDRYLSTTLFRSICSDCNP